MIKKISLFIFIGLFLSSSSYAKVFKSVKYVGNMDGIVVKNFKVEGSSFEVGSTIIAEFDLINDSKKPVKLGKYGALIACRDPNNKNRDFGHQYKYHTIQRHHKIHVKGKIKINKNGEWTFWPGFYILKWGWGPADWGAIKLNAKGSSHNGSGGSHHSNNPKKLVLNPPFNTCAGWKTSPGVAQTRYYCNQNTGYIGIFDSSWVGGAASYAVQYIYFNSPRKQRVKIRATFYYTGGTKIAGVAAFAGLQAMYIHGKKNSRKDIVAGLNYNIAVQKIIDVALLTLPGAKQVQDVKEALELISTLKDATTLLNELKDLYNVHKAKKYVYTFYINAKKGGNFVGIGLRGNCSGIVTGSSYVVVAAQLVKVEVLF